MENENVSKIKEAILRNNELFDALADLYKVFGDGTRVRILCALGHGFECFINFLFNF